VRQLISTLIDCVGKGGNLLLNVGPTGRGEFDYRAVERLKGIGAWMHHHGRSIYGCTEAPSEFGTPANCLLTYNPDSKRLYVHILAWPYKHLHLDGKAYTDRVGYAQLLHDASEVKLRAGDSARTLSVELPQSEPRVEIPVVELYLKD
jgi:alpha-L-fucosidase